MSEEAEAILVRRVEWNANEHPYTDFVLALTAIAKQHRENGGSDQTIKAALQWAQLALVAEET